ncbi:ferric enterobactin transporter fepE [Escherichia coli]|nr:ferric enterobactin transporter fepE [Escherichia coli]
MSSLNIKQGSDAHFPDYPLASPSNNEIDLLNLISVLWRGNDSNLLIVFYVQIMPDDFVMQLHRF